MYRVALSREATKYYQKVSANTARRLEKCFADLEIKPFRGPNIKLLKGVTNSH
jgi:hypothetical protein